MPGAIGMDVKKLNRAIGRWKPLALRRKTFAQYPRKRRPPIYRRGPRRAFRPILGMDPLEMRAVPKEQVRGSLEERIVYKELLRRGIRFDFQSSMLGGRMQLGGIVADFILPDYNLVISVKGTIWHQGLDFYARDKMQEVILQNTYNLRVLSVWDWQVRNQSILEDIFDRTFGGYAT